MRPRLILLTPLNVQPDHPYLPLRRGDLAFEQGQYDVRRPATTGSSSPGCRA